MASLAIGLSAAVYVMEKLCSVTGGMYAVIRDGKDFRDILKVKGNMIVDVMVLLVQRLGELDRVFVPKWWWHAVVHQLRRIQ